MNTPQEFAPLLAALRSLAPEGAVLATLTRTSGSTFRRAGARMLIHADGRVLRGLSGGCPERDISLHAREALEDGRARVLHYNRQQNFDVMLEMGCGGELEVLLEPLRSAADIAFAEAAQRCLQQRRRGVLATVYTHRGVCLPQPQHLLHEAQQIHDDISDPALSAAVQQRLVQLPARFKPQVETLAECEVLFEVLEAPLQATLIGSNASSHALARLLVQLGWSVQLIPTQAEAAHAEDLPAEVQHRALSAQQLDTLHFDARSHVLVMTHNFELDLDYLRALVTQPLAYLGTVGARTRVQRLRTQLGEIRANFHAPAGLDIGSETPEEIALAIAAEMLAVANGHEGGRLSRLATPIHR